MRDGQPYIDYWLLSDEALSKIPAPLDIEGARLKLARRFTRSLPKQVEIDLAWREHVAGARERRRQIRGVLR
jgi:hypothetical protein